VTPYGWEGNRGFDVTQAMRHYNYRLEVYSNQTSDLQCPTLVLGLFSPNSDNRAIY